MKFTLITANPKAEMVVRIAYPGAESR
jgi:hypothetical protein